MKHGEDNPYLLAAARLFDTLPVIVEGQWMGADLPPVHPDEAAQVHGAAHRRRVEFATGRSCARRALARMNIGDFALRNDPASRAPRWPGGVVGSITHTGGVPGGYCGVAVASTRDVLAVGFDAEVGESLSPDIWSRILTSTEAERLLTFPPSRRHRLARLAFSAKECFYKAQFPLTHRFLEFEDVEVSVDEGSSTFDVRVICEPTIDRPFGHCRGRYADGPEMVFTGIALPAELT